MAIRYKSLVSDEERQLINKLWEQPAVVDLLKADDSWSELRSEWLLAAGDDRPTFEQMMEALRNDDKELAPLARELLKNQTTPASQKQFALLALAKSRFPEDDLLIRGYFEDASPIDTYFSRGIVIKSQLRDVALAAMIVRAELAPSDFGFKYLKRDERSLFSPSTLGFKDDAERRAAFQQWLMREDIKKK